MTNLQQNPVEQVRLEARRVSCIRDDRKLFDDLDFCLMPGEVLLLEGSNGSGKTTLLRALCGIRLPDAGSILWCGQTLEQAGSEYYRELIYLGHLDGVKRDLTVLENLEMVQKLGQAGDMSLQAALQHMGLAGYEYTPARHLSAGQRRRLALSRLLVSRARLWILDEPFTSLDKQSIALVESLVAAHTRNGGMAVMTSHHDVSLADTRVQQIRLARTA